MSVRFARPIHGSAFSGGSATIQSRLIDASGELLDPESIQAIAYSIEELTPSGLGSPSMVVGHQSIELDPPSVLFPTLRLGGGWDVDSAGFNFQHEIDSTVYPAFPRPEGEYLVRYTLTRATEQPIVFAAHIKAV